MEGHTVVADISTSLREQAAAANELAQKVNQISGMVEAANSTVEETATAAAHMRQLAEGLDGAVHHFRV